MHCPYCQAPAFETTPHCPRCGFSLERVGAFYGVMPRLTPGLSDLAGLFRPRDVRRLHDATARLRDRFPQVTISVVTTTLEPTQPLTAYAFWIFNRGGICLDLARGGKSRDLLLTLDAANARASLMIGYGLEPFVSQTLLQDIVNQGAPHFARDRWIDGVVTVIDAATRTLSDVFNGLEKTYGLDMEALQRGEAPTASAPPPGEY
jgi:uncharacterized membrane protein YgcG